MVIKCVVGNSYTHVTPPSMLLVFVSGSKKAASFFIRGVYIAFLIPGTGGGKEEEEVTESIHAELHLKKVAPGPGAYESKTGRFKSQECARTAMQVRQFQLPFGSRIGDD